MISRKKILLTTAISAAALRCFFGIMVYFSPYFYFSRVPGLDMETLLAFSDGSGRYPLLFVAHRFLISFARLLNGGSNSVAAIMLIQALIGVAGAVVAADLTLKLSGKRLAALFAGLLYAFYAPFLIYEFAVLQESLLVNLILFGLYALLIAKLRRYPVGMTFFAGVLLALAAVGRPVSLLLGIALFIMLGASGIRRKSFAWLAYGAGFGSILLAGAVFNYIFAGIFDPFFRVGKYILQTNFGSGGVSESGAWRIFAVNMANRIPDFFSARSIAENLNFYFLAMKFPILKYLIRPEGVIPLGFSGMLLLSLREKSRRRAWLLILPVIFLTMVLISRPAMERYQLFVVPYFIIAGAWLASTLLEMRRIPDIAMSMVLLIAVFGISFILSPKPVLRGDDFVNWGIAAEAGGFVAESENSYYDAWHHFHHRSGAFNYYRTLFRSCRFHEAGVLCIEYMKLYGVSTRCGLYLTLSLISDGKMAEAKQVFAVLEAPPENHRDYKMYMDVRDMLREKNE